MSEKVNVERLSKEQIEELAWRGKHLSPPDNEYPHFDSPEHRERYVCKTVGLTARGIAWLASMAANGGVPSKPTGKTHNLPIIGEVGGEALARNIHRGVQVILLLAILIVVLMNRSTVKMQHGEDSILIIPQQQEAHK